MPHFSCPIMHAFKMPMPQSTSCSSMRSGALSSNVLSAWIPRQFRMPYTKCTLSQECYIRINPFAYIPMEKRTARTLFRTDADEPNSRSASAIACDMPGTSGASSRLGSDCADTAQNAAVTTIWRPTRPADGRRIVMATQRASSLCLTASVTHPRLHRLQPKCDVLEQRHAAVLYGWEERDPSRRPIKETHRPAQCCSYWRHSRLCRRPYQLPRHRCSASASAQPRAGRNPT